MTKLSLWHNHFKIDLINVLEIEKKNLQQMIKINKILRDKLFKCWVSKITKILNLTLMFI